jgi:hypothetical protein
MAFCVDFAEEFTAAEEDGYKGLRVLTINYAMILNECTHKIKWC